MAIAKALGGGLPIGAWLATERAAAGMVAGTHGSTFGGNPPAVAACNAVLDVMLAPGFFERVEATGQLLRSRLQQLAEAYPTLFAALRGEGLLPGLRRLGPAGGFVRQLGAN